MVLIKIPLMTKDVEYVFRYFFASCVFTLVKCLFISFAHFLNGPFSHTIELREFFIYSTSTLQQIFRLQIFFSSSL